MVAEINAYLNGGNPEFNAGFSLFCKYSTNQSLMSWIGRKKDMEMLLYELKKLDRAGATPLNVNAAVHEIQYNCFRDELQKALPVPVPVEDSKIVFKTYDERRTRRADLPEDLQKVYDDITSDYKLNRGYHEKMKAATTDQDRAEFRQRIVETTERIQEGWTRIDTYLQEAETKKVDDKFNESSCRSYISKALKSEKISDKVAAGVRIRVKALQEHGCVISNDTLETLKNKNLI